MDNIEKFKNDKNKPGDLEEKLDNLTDQLLNAFENKDDIIWENGKPDKFRKCGIGLAHEYFDKLR